MKLYSFFNSSASYRVRIAMALKGIDHQTVGVNIRIGQQNALEYRRLNPVGLVPALITDNGESLGNRWRLLTGWTDISRRRRCYRRTIRSACACWKWCTPSVATSTHQQHARIALPQR